MERLEEGLAIPIAHQLSPNGAPTTTISPAQTPEHAAAHRTAWAHILTRIVHRTFPQVRALR
eukprot:4731-Heterococcus_DN1.PRE.3